MSCSKFFERVLGLSTELLSDGVILCSSPETNPRKPLLVAEKLISLAESQRDTQAADFRVDSMNKEPDKQRSRAVSADFVATTWRRF